LTQPGEDGEPVATNQPVETEAEEVCRDNGALFARRRIGSHQSERSGTQNALLFAL
jgi:hypothetical protein